MSDWSHDFTLKFIEYYKTEQCLWNPLSKYRKDKKKVADAWVRISDRLNKPVAELKRKKEALMATFRNHFKKRRQSLRFGAGEGDIYQPIWFAYRVMEEFLLPVYSPEKIEISENMTSESDYVEETEANTLLAMQSNEPLLQSTSTPNFRLQAPGLAERQVTPALSTSTNDLNKRLHEDDECELFGKLLSKKLRRLPDDERTLFMYKIDGLFIQRMNQQSDPLTLDTSS